MQSIVRYFLWISLILSACQVFRTEDTQATLQAQNNGYIAQATVIAQTQQALDTQVLATAEAAGTYVVEMESVNQQLLATVRAGDPPTVERLPGDAPGAAGTPGVSGTQQIVEVTTTSQVRESDGCANGTQVEFSPDVAQIYVTARALNIRAGTRMDFEWFYEGTVVLQNSWTVPQDSADFCFWYAITPADVTFSPGNWSVRLYADGVAIEPAASFSIIGM